MDAAREWNVEPCEAIDIDPPGATATERARAVAARLTVGRMHDVTRIIHAALATRKVTMFDRLGTAVGTIPGQHGHAPRPRSCGSCCGPMLRPYRVSCPAMEPSTTTEPGDADHVAERALLRIMAHDPATAGDDVSARLRQTLQADDDHQQRTPEANAAYAARRRTQHPSPMAMAATDVPEDTLTRTSSLRSHCRQAAKIAAALADKRRKAAAPRVPEARDVFRRSARTNGHRRGLPVCYYCYLQHQGGNQPMTEADYFRRVRIAAGSCSEMPTDTASLPMGPPPTGSTEHAAAFDIFDRCPQDVHLVGRSYREETGARGTVEAVAPSSSGRLVAYVTLDDMDAQPTASTGPDWTEGHGCREGRISRASLHPGGTDAALTPT